MGDFAGGTLIGAAEGMPLEFCNAASVSRVKNVPVALATGVWPPFGNVTFPAVETMRDGQYHEIALPGTYRRDTDPDDPHWFWIAPVDNPDVAYLYVDRLIGVRA